METYLCHYCGTTYADVYTLQSHLSFYTVAHARPLKDDRNLWELTDILARAIIALAEVKDPNRGTSEDVDDIVKSAYDFLGMVCPFDTLMLDPSQDAATTLLMRIKSLPPSTR